MDSTQVGGTVPCHYNNAISERLRNPELSTWKLFSHPGQYLLHTTRGCGQFFWREACGWQVSLVTPFPRAGHRFGAQQYQGGSMSACAPLLTSALETQSQKLRI